jgi:hypothetical protein
LAAAAGYSSARPHTCQCLYTEGAIRQYLAVSGLDKVKVRVNQYDPAGEWQRLRDNHSVSGPVRYTIGTLSVVGCTVLPGRVFGGDHYNPYTNSVYLYSDVPAMAVYQGGYEQAKEVVGSGRGATTPTVTKRDEPCYRRSVRPRLEGNENCIIYFLRFSRGCDPPRETRRGRIALQSAPVNLPCLHVLCAALTVL